MARAEVFIEMCTGNAKYQNQTIRSEESIGTFDTRSGVSI